MAYHTIHKLAQSLHLGACPGIVKGLLYYKEMTTTEALCVQLDNFQYEMYVVTSGGKLQFAGHESRMNRRYWKQTLLTRR